MADKGEGIFNFTIPAVMTHPQLFEARAIGPKGKESGKPKYSCSFLLKPDSQDLKDMKALAGKIAKAKWPGRDFGADLKDGRFKLPFVSGDKLADQQKAKGRDAEFNRGHIVLNARSLFAPNLSVIQNGKIVDLEDPARLAAKSQFFFGAEVLVQVNFVAYEGVGANPDGVTAYVNKILATGKGTKIAGGQSSAEAFKSYIGGHSAENPMGDDEVAF